MALYENDEMFSVLKNKITQSIIEASCPGVKDLHDLEYESSKRTTRA